MELKIRRQGDKYYITIDGIDRYGPYADIDTAEKELSKIKKENSMYRENAMKCRYCGHECEDGSGVCDKCEKKYEGKKSELKVDRLNRGRARYGSKDNGKTYVIPTENAQLVYGIQGAPGENFRVDRNGTMLPIGNYKVIGRGAQHHSGPWGSFSEIEVEAQE